MSDIWTAADWQRGMVLADRRGNHAARRILMDHGIHANHCGGYEVLAWPCPVAAAILDRLLGGAA